LWDSLVLGGGWAKPKNGEANFWARSWRCGVSVANTAKANYLINIFVAFLRFFTHFSHYSLISLEVATALSLNDR